MAEDGGGGGGRRRMAEVAEVKVKVKEVRIGIVVKPPLSMLDCLQKPRGWRKRKVEKERKRMADIIDRPTAVACSDR